MDQNVLTNSASWNAQIGPIRRTSAARSSPPISAAMSGVSSKWRCGERFNSLGTDCRHTYKNSICYVVRG